MAKVSESMIKIMAKTPRIAQFEAIDAMWDNNHGLLEIACGVGKTWIQVFTFVREILNAEKEGRKFKGIWVCHRLLLEAQVKNNFNSLTNNFFAEHNVKLIMLNSEGDNSLKQKGADEMATGMPEHVIYFTTTASIIDYVNHHNTLHKNGLDALANNILSKVDLYVHDEAHKEFTDSLVKTVQAAMNDHNKKYYFFTATPGKYLTSNLTTIYHCNFAEAVKSGYIVKPRFFGMEVKDYANLNDLAYTNLVIRTVKHCRKSRKENANLIVFLPSVDSVATVGYQLNAVKNNLKRKAIRNVNIYEIISDKDIDIEDINGNKVEYNARLRINGNDYNNNNKKYTKAEILEIIRNDKKEKIILNAFMLTEGIDLPELNSVLIACQKSDASLYQAVSRGCRKSQGKVDFNLYAITETGIADNMINFLKNLADITGGIFDFGGIAEDQNDGSVDNDDNDSSEDGNIVNNILTKYKDLDVCVKAMKTDFDKWTIIANEIGEFKEIMMGSDTIAKINAATKYTELWNKKYPELVNTYLNEEELSKALMTF